MTAPPGTSGGGSPPAKVRHSLGTWLLAAFVALALLPAVTGLPAWLGSRTIEQPLAEVANVVDAFGRHDRAFRASIRGLYARLFVTRNFQDRATYEATAAGIREDLASMREHVGALAGSNFVPATNDFAERQDKIEAFTGDYLQLVDDRLSLVERSEALTDAGREDELSATLAELADLDEREFDARMALRSDVIAMINRLVEIDAANDQAASDLLRTARQTLHGYNVALISSITIGSLLALGIVLFFVRGNVLLRLRRLTESTRRLTDGQLEVPVTLKGRDELAELARTLETFRLSALELRQSKSVLAERSEQLEQANRELDQFAYVASHDLKAPLRAISSLLEFLSEDIEESLQPESRKQLAMIKGRAVRLEALLDSLLEYSRAGRLRAAPEKVDLRLLVEESVALVAPAGADIGYHGGFGVVSTCRAPLEQVVRNLVDNAFKHNDQEHGQVSIACDIVKGKAQVTVSDNGPGIEPANHEDIFEMFRTLQPRDKVEGSGMGLAILRKLVESYGGTITLQSDPARARGATFTVTWPLDAVLKAHATSDIPTDVLRAVARQA